MEQPSFVVTRFFTLPLSMFDFRTEKKLVYSVNTHIFVNFNSYALIEAPLTFLSIVNIVVLWLYMI